MIRDWIVSVEIGFMKRKLETRDERRETRDERRETRDERREHVLYLRDSTGHLYTYSACPFPYIKIKNI